MCGEQVPHQHVKMSPQYFKVYITAPRSGPLINQLDALVNFYCLKTINFRQKAKLRGPPDAPAPALSIRTITACSEGCAGQVTPCARSSRGGKKGPFGCHYPIQFVNTTHFPDSTTQFPEMGSSNCTQRLICLFHVETHKVFTSI